MSKPAGAIDRVLRDWGAAEPGPMNGAIGDDLAELLLKIVQEQPDVKSVCDLGCGTGYLASRLGALGHRVVGIDASDKLLAVANEHYASAQVSFARAVFGEDSEDLPGRFGSFDLVISSDVVEHLFAPKSLFETASRLLRPGGHLVVGTPYHGYLKNVAISVLANWDVHHSVHWDGGHVKFFSVATLTNMAGEAGFSVEGFRFYGRIPWFWKNMICLAHKRPA